MHPKDSAWSRSERSAVAALLGDVWTVLQVRLVAGDVAAVGVRTPGRFEAVGLREASLGVLLRATCLGGGALGLGREALGLGRARRASARCWAAAAPDSAACS